MTAVSHSFADPTAYVPAAHQAGIKVLAQVQKVSHAKRVALAGVDAITAQRTEAGGHTGHNGTLPMVPAVIDVAGRRLDKVIDGVGAEPWGTTMAGAGNYCH